MNMKEQRVYTGIHGILHIGILCKGVYEMSGKQNAICKRKPAGRVAAFVLAVLTVLSVNPAAHSYAAEVETSSAGTLTFEEMLEDISLKSGIPEYSVKDCLRNQIDMRALFEEEKMSAADKLSSLKYVSVDIATGDFPELEDGYRSTGVTVYGIGFTSGQDHVFIEEIVFAVVDTRDTGDGESRRNYFGDLYVNLEKTDRVYVSVNGGYGDREAVPHVNYSDKDETGFRMGVLPDRWCWEDEILDVSGTYEF